MRHIKRTGIYKMVSPSGKVYIGQSRDLTNRKSRYKTLCCKNQIKLYNSLLKYGFDNHNFSVVIYLDQSIPQADLDWHEWFYMQMYIDAGYELLNLREAGSYGKHPIESRLKNSQSHKGKIPWNKGKRGLQIAWNKGIHEPRKKYKFKYKGELVEIENLKLYCSKNSLSYCAMINLHNAKHHYKNKPYKEYERA